MINNIYIGNEYNIAKQPEKIYTKINDYSGEVFSAYIANNMGLAKCIYTKAILPPEYQQVEYIQGTGTQYINTGVYQSANNMAIEVKFAFTSTSYSNVGYVMGCANGTSNRFQISIGSTSSSNSGKIILGCGAGYWVDSSVINNSIHTYKVDMKNKAVYKDGSSKTKTSSSAYSQTTNSSGWIGLFNGYSASATSITKGKLYNAKIWSNGTLTHNYYPCYRKTNDEIGLYDIITKEFKTRMGSGTFEKGNNINQEL